MGFPGSHPALEWLARALSLPICPPPTPAHPLLHSQTGCMIAAALLTAFREVRAMVAPHRELYALPVMSCPDTTLALPACDPSAAETRCNGHTENQSGLMWHTSSIAISLQPGGRPDFSSAYAPDAAMSSLVLDTHKLSSSAGGQNTYEPGWCRSLRYIPPS